jgi:hypothetical protein
MRIIFLSPHINITKTTLLSHFADKGFCSMFAAGAGENTKSSVSFFKNLNQFLEMFINAHAKESNLCSLENY